MPRKSLHIIKQTWKTPCGEYRNAFCIELTFKLCTYGCEKETLSKRGGKSGTKIYASVRTIVYAYVSRGRGIMGGDSRVSTGVAYFRQVGASFPFKRNALRNEELWYPLSLILLVFCVFIEKFISFGVASEIGCSDYANEWSIKKNKTRYFEL